MPCPDMSSMVEAGHTRSIVSIYNLLFQVTVYKFLGHFNKKTHVGFKNHHESIIYIVLYLVTVKSVLGPCER